MTKKRRNAIIVNVILFIISLYIISALFLLSYSNNALLFTTDNTFKHKATVEYAVVNRNTDTLDIHIKENKQKLIIGMGAFNDKLELLNQIKNGESITFWTYYFDTYGMSDVDTVQICAFSINNEPIVTIEERNRMQQKGATKIKISCIVIVVILESIGVFLLVRAFRKPKKNSVDNMEESDSHGKT